MISSLTEEAKHPLKRKRKTTESGEISKKTDQDQPQSAQASSPSSASSVGTQETGNKQKKRKQKQSDKPDNRGSSSANHSEAKDDEDTPALDIEAISHKERRKRKKLEKKMTALPTKNPEAAAEEEENLQSKTRNSKNIETIFTTTSRSNYSIWVGNLLFTTTAQELARFFESCGKITRLNMPSGKKEHEHNKGFAYVDFETESGVDNAIQRSESSLGGRKLLIKRASDYSGRPSITMSPSLNASIPPTTLMKSARKILDQQKQPPAPCLYFGNLGFETTSEGIMSMLRAHHQAQVAWKPKAVVSNVELKSKKLSPEEKENENLCEKSTKDVDLKDTSTTVGIRKVRMGAFEDSGKCKGFAFVDFESVAHATNALLNIKNHKLDGRNLQVEYASADAVKRGGGSVRSIQNKRQSRNTAPADGDHQKPNHRSKPLKVEKSQTRTHDAPSRTESADVALPNLSQPLGSVMNPNDDYPGIKPKKEYRGRQKPGAVLANARRAPTGIVKNPEQCGKKTVFA